MLSLTPPPSSSCFSEREVKENDAITFTYYYPSQSSVEGSGLPATARSCNTAWSRTRSMKAG